MYAEAGARTVLSGCVYEYVSNGPPGSTGRGSGLRTARQSRPAHPSVVALTCWAGHQERVLGGRREGVSREEVAKATPHPGVALFHFRRRPCSAELSREKKFGRDERVGTWSRELIQEATMT